MSAITYNLGRTLRERRKQLALTQSRVAEVAGIAQATIAKIESGAISNVASIGEVARSLGMELVIVPAAALTFLDHLQKLHAGKTIEPSRLVGNDPEDADDA